MNGSLTTRSSPSRLRCSRCAADLSTLVRAACFCPRCGVRLADNRAGNAPDEQPDLAALTLPGLFTSTVVRGYANAMFRLGFRYEVRHNDDEAVRCYGKASRLGNEPAAARLLDIPVATVLPEDHDAPSAS